MTDTMEVQETETSESTAETSEPKVKPQKIDLTPNENDGEILSFYKQTMTQINEIDEQLDAGLDSTGKRKLTNDLVEANQSKWEKVSNELIPQMETMTPDVLAGVFYGLIRAFTDRFKEPIDEWLQAQVDSQPKPEETLSENEKKELSEARAELAASVKQIVTMATTFGLCPELEPWALPRRRGAVGKRGKRALTLYTWSIDGEDQPEGENTVKAVALKVGFEKAGDFTKALRDAEIDTKNPPVTFSVELKGKEVTATRTVPLEDNDDVSTEPDSDEDDDDDSSDDE